MTKFRLLRGFLLSVMLIVVSVGHAGESDRLFTVFDASDGLAANGAQVIICTKTGRMVISSIGHINFYNGSSFEHISPQQENIYELPKYLGHYHLYFDRSHHLWIKDKYQVTCVDLMTEMFVPDVQRVLKEMGFDGKADDLFVDEDGCLMILSGSKLYNCKTGKWLPVRKGKSLQDVGSSQEKVTLLFYDDSSVEAFDHKTGKLEYIKTLLEPKDAAKYSQSSVILADKTGFYQIRNGEQEAVLLYIDAVSGKSRILMSTPLHLNNMALRGGMLYLAYQMGYWTYNVKTEEKTYYEVLKSTSYQSIHTDVNDIAFDLQGGMWLGTERRGLLYSKPHTSPFHIYPWSDQKAMNLGALLYYDWVNRQEPMPRRTNCVYHDSRGWTWMGTYTGIKLQKTDKDSPLVYTHNDGLNNDVVHSIIEDNDHNIWVSTSNGISVLLIENDSLHKIVSYNKDDNVPTGAFENGRAMKLDDGTIIMQALDYIVEFNPSHFHTTKKTDIKLYPKLIQLSVNGRVVHPGMSVDGNVILERAITRTKEVNLNYDQNTISLLFSGLNFFRPIQTYYRIRIKGWQNEWHIYSPHDGSGRVDSRGLLNYPIIDIPPGQYEIELQASMSPEEWPVDPYVWTIKVNEPWWRMTIVYVTLGLLLLAMMVANFVFYNRNMRLRLNRTNIEGSVIRRVKNFASMCDNMENDSLAPYQIDSDSVVNAEENAFIDAMVKVVPYVHTHPKFSMANLAKVAGLDMDRFYELMSSNLYKKPRVVVLKLRLQHVAEMLKTTNKGIDEIAYDLKFSSPNYMIAAFYHQYRQTPDDYRATSSR